MRLWVPVLLVSTALSTGCASAEEDESVDSSNLTASSATYHITVDYTLDGDSYTKRCTGFLVSRTRMITAAHCFPSKGKDFVVEAWNVATGKQLTCGASACAPFSMLRDRDVAKISVSAPAGAATLKVIDADYLAKDNKSLPALAFYTNSRPGNSPSGWSMSEKSTSGYLDQLGTATSSIFKIFLTGTQTKTGDSGGPLLNSRGEVIGSIVSENEATYFGMSGVRDFVVK